MKAKRRQHLEAEGVGTYRVVAVWVGGAAAEVEIDAPAMTPSVTGSAMGRYFRPGSCRRVGKWPCILSRDSWHDFCGGGGRLVGLPA